eukprot:6476044-Amphidinium_carterae.1
MPVPLRIGVNNTREAKARPTLIFDTAASWLSGAMASCQGKLKASPVGKRSLRYFCDQCNDTMVDSKSHYAKAALMGTWSCAVFSRLLVPLHHTPGIRPTRLAITNTENVQHMFITCVPALGASGSLGCTAYMSCQKFTHP